MLPPWREKSFLTDVVLDEESKRIRIRIGVDARKIEAEVLVVMVVTQVVIVPVKVSELDHGNEETSRTVNRAAVQWAQWWLRRLSQRLQEGEKTLATEK